MDADSLTGLPPIRWIQPHDVQKIAALELQNEVYPWDEEKILDTIRRRNFTNSELDDCSGVVAEHAGQLAGHLIYELRGSHLHLLKLVINPSCDQEIIAKSMFDYLREKLATHKIDNITVDIAQTKKISLLTKIGVHGVEAAEITGRDDYAPHRNRPSSRVTANSLLQTMLNHLNNHCSVKWELVIPCKGEDGRVYRIATPDDIREKPDDILFKTSNRVPDTDAAYAELTSFFGQKIVDIPNSGEVIFPAKWVRPVHTLQRFDNDFTVAFTPTDPEAASTLKIGTAAPPEKSLNPRVR